MLHHHFFPTFLFIIFISFFFFLLSPKAQLLSPLPLLSFVIFYFSILSGLTPLNFSCHLFSFDRSPSSLLPFPPFYLLFYMHTTAAIFFYIFLLLTMGQNASPRSAHLPLHHIMLQHNLSTLFPFPSRFARLFCIFFFFLFFFLLRPKRDVRIHSQLPVKRKHCIPSCFLPLLLYVLFCFCLFCLVLFFFSFEWPLIHLECLNSRH